MRLLVAPQDCDRVKYEYTQYRATITGMRFVD